MTVHQLNPATSGALAVLGIEHADTDGRLLRLHCGPTHHEAVAQRDITIAPGCVRLEILAASHRVAIRRDGANWEPIETVACSSGPGAVSPWVLPNRHRWTTDSWRLLFDSGIATGPAAIERARTSVAEAVAHPRGLAAAFPGHPDAATALVVSESDADEVHWRTWHLYPGDDPHVVMTMTTARRLIDEEVES